jgi:hypothetical protein
MADPGHPKMVGPAEAEVTSPSVGRSVTTAGSTVLITVIHDRFTT